MTFTSILYSPQCGMYIVQHKLHSLASKTFYFGFKNIYLSFTDVQIVALNHFQFKKCYDQNITHVL